MSETPASYELFVYRSLLRLSGCLKSLEPDWEWMALAQGRGELIWWPYIVAKFVVNFWRYCPRRFCCSCWSSQRQAQLGADRIRDTVLHGTDGGVPERAGDGVAGWMMRLCCDHG